MSRKHIRIFLRQTRRKMGHGLWNGSVVRVCRIEPSLQTAFETINIAISIRYPTSQVSLCQRCEQFSKRSKIIYFLLSGQSKTTFGFSPSTAEGVALSLQLKYVSLKSRTNQEKTLESPTQRWKILFFLSKETYTCTCEMKERCQVI